MKPKVKSTEKSRVLSTKDYSIFDFPDKNISKKHLNLLIESISEKDLTPDFPIIVDDSYKIIDGKYKFLALYELKLPIHYKIAEVTTLQDAVRIKEILRKAPFKEIIQIYIDKHQYRDLILIQKETNDFFSYRQILGVIEKKFPDKDDYCNLTPNRYKIASGKLVQWDYSKTLQILNKAKFLIDEFKWSVNGALKLTSHKFCETIDFKNDSKLLRQCAEIHRAGNMDEFEQLHMHSYMKPHEWREHYESWLEYEKENI